jgi:hypothetical protein
VTPPERRAVFRNQSIELRWLIGGEAAVLVPDQLGEDARSAWSPDGKWIYFSSERSGRGEIRRMPSGGGPALQMTKNGGGAAYPSRPSASKHGESGPSVQPAKQHRSAREQLTEMLIFSANGEVLV